MSYRFAFNLDQYPKVCRLCLKEPGPTGISLEVYDAEIGTSIGEYIARHLLELPKNTDHLVPQEICVGCMSELRSFARFRKKTIVIQQLVEALVYVKRGNNEPLEELFQNRFKLTKMLHSMEICDNDKVAAEHMIQEFPRYLIASIRDDKSRSRNQPHTKKVDHASIPVQQVPQTEIIYVKIEDSSPFDDSTTVETSEMNDFSDRNVEEPPEPAPDDCDPLHNKHKPRSFACDQCPRVLGSASTLRMHKELHSGPPKYPCENCDKQFYSDSSRKNHIILKHSNREKRSIRNAEYMVTATGPMNQLMAQKQQSTIGQEGEGNPYLFTCEFCGRRFKTKPALNSHLKTHEGEPIFTCQYCDYKAIKYQYVRNHVKSQHKKSNAFECDICQLVFTRKSGMMDHRNTHTKEKNFKCSMCEKVFYAERYLKRHVTVVHERKLLFCTYCPKDFRNTWNLLDHIEVDHGIQKRFICDICLNVSSTQSALDEHKKRHETPNHLECGRCLLLNSTQEALGNHLCISYRDDYFCCGRDQRHHTHFNKHMFLVHGLRTNVRVKPVPGELIGVTRSKRKRVESCTFCGEMFDTRTLKKKHMAVCREAVNEGVINKES
ncbi:zinc finger protein 816-like [Uranotaenia lowii]|uniref:zinc finger protein 816-like n=1 Tax=Uranotaenia lowii TaxID=190385 RepID=UPI0024795613|nr:zinc finger protein 816-like [Uranotaenia lowii]